LARRIAENAPLSVHYSKRVLYQAASAGSHHDPARNGGDLRELGAKAMDVIFASSDAIEGATAFAEKRPPLRTGK
jgi:crotonobetainyl-CoA hydratase